MTMNTATSGPVTVNGVDVDQIKALIGAIGQDPVCAKNQYRARNKWLGGGLNRTTIKGFRTGGVEDTTRTQAFELHTDVPAAMAGQNIAPNPVEFVLHALAGCLTTTLVYHAAVHDIEIANVETELEGDMDLRGLFGMSDEARKGYHNIRVHMRVESTASAEELRELAMFSPVYEMVSNSLPVAFTLETV
jgi:uncharacterized OsmC-like protein